jgi:hypothetical protein
MTSSGSPGRKSPPKGRATRSRRQARNAARQPTRAEIQAMEARSRATVVAGDVVAVEERPARAGRAPSRTAERQRATIPRPTLSKSQEFAFIRSDLRRLIVTAGPLLLLMILLLVVIDR